MLLLYTFITITVLGEKIVWFKNRKTVVKSSCNRFSVRKKNKYTSSGWKWWKSIIESSDTNTLFLLCAKHYSKCFGPQALMIVLFLKLCYIHSFIQQFFMEYNMQGIKWWTRDMFVALWSYYYISSNVKDMY